MQVYDVTLRASFAGLEHTGWFALGVAVSVLVALAPRRIAAAAGAVSAVAAAAVWGDAAWRVLYGQLHESTWSPTLICVVPVAGIVGIATRDPWRAAAIGGWLTVLVLRGVHEPYPAGGFWLSLTAAAPAAAVLLTSLALLVPPLRLRAPARRPAQAP